MGRSRWFFRVTFEMFEDFSAPLRRNRVLLWQGKRKSMICELLDLLENERLPRNVGNTFPRFSADDKSGIRPSRLIHVHKAHVRTVEQ